MIEVNDIVKTPRGEGVVFGMAGDQIYVVGKGFYSWFDRKDVKLFRKEDR